MDYSLFSLQQVCQTGPHGGYHPPPGAAAAPPAMAAFGGGASSAAGTSNGARRTTPPPSTAEPLKLGSLTEVWKQRSEWVKFVAFLDAAEGEGEDSDGRKMSLGRYARFLELYVRLDQAERVEAKPEDEVKSRGNYF